MKIQTIFLSLILFTMISSLSAAKYAGEIFKMGAGVRNFAMGRTGLTDERSPAMAYWNASLLLETDMNRLELMHAEEFSGLLKYDTISGSFGSDIRIGITLARIGIDNIHLTRLPNPDDEPGPGNQPVLDKTVNNSDYILYLGLARELWNVPIGFTPKVVYRDLAGLTAWGFGADISTHYVANDYLKWGIRIRDIIPTTIIWDDGEREKVNTGGDVELRITSRLPVLNRPLYLYLNTEISNDSMISTATANIGNVSFEPHFGAEILFHPRFSLICGMNIDRFTAGGEVNYQNFLLNYSFEQNTKLDNSHRVSIGYAF
jgi:hypothetical protein